jgi:hypothetical protein
MQIYRVAKLVRYLNSASQFVMLRALRSESYYECRREICSILHCLEIVLYVRRNLLTLCLICRKHGFNQT